MRRMAVVVAALGLVAGGCGGEKAEEKKAAPPSRISIVSPKNGATVIGTLKLAMSLKVPGFSIVKADGDTSGKTGHWHVFVDRDPVAPGAVVPKEAGIVHSAVSPIAIDGLTPGAHKLTVVLGNGAHQRIGDDIATVSVTVQ